MIDYKQDKYGFTYRDAYTKRFLIFRGSVLPKSCTFAFACAVFTLVLHRLFTAYDLVETVRLSDKGFNVMGMFTFVLGFLLVFRTQQSYSRWWSGGAYLLELR